MIERILEIIELELTTHLAVQVQQVLKVLQVLLGHKVQQALLS
jgi:hypothetical protein